MHDRVTLTRRNKVKIQKEYDEAFDEGNYALANRIFDANPDITPAWLRNPNPDSPDENPWQDDGGET